MATDIQKIAIPPLELHWTDWYAWLELADDMIPLPAVAGVYEARHAHEAVRLTIGKASNLRMRVKQGLVKGQLPHSSGERIRAHEDVASIVIRWAETERPAAAEEELHRLYKLAYGALPKYTKRT